MVVNLTCTVEAANPTVDTFALYENGNMISSKTDKGVWIKTLDTGGEVTYKCQANNSIGTGSSENISFTIEGNWLQRSWSFQKVINNMLSLRREQANVIHMTHRVTCISGFSKVLLVPLIPYIA